MRATNKARVAQGPKAMLCEILQGLGLGGSMVLQKLLPKCRGDS